MIMDLKNIRFENIQNNQNDDMLRIIKSVLVSADPYQNVKRNIIINSQFVKVNDISYILYRDTRIFVVAIGKASLSMSKGAFSQLGNAVHSGICVCKVNPENEDGIGNIKVVTGSHPIPDEKSVLAGKEIQKYTIGLTEHDLVLFLVSGGGSALVCLPPENVKLEDIQETTSHLLKAGASIKEINTIRKHLDTFKGGGFLRMCSPARVSVLVISDVVGSPLDVIASGPAFPDPSTYKDGIEVLEKYNLVTKIPKSILEHLESGSLGKIPETVKPSDTFFSHASHSIIASNLLSAQAVMESAIETGIQAQILTTELTCEAKTAGEYLAKQAWKIADSKQKQLLITGGETVVNVKGSGLGGRNLETALASVKAMSGIPNIILFTFATDGEDGVTNTAGALVTGQTFSRATQLGLDPDKYLENNDAWSFFKKLDDLIITGSTGTNVNDLSFILKY